MKAIHLQTRGVHDPHEAALVEMCVRLAEGVSDVASIRTLDLVSVLYDERETDPRDIVAAIRSIGFDARELARAS
jgi:copper chaperone CopZ